MTEELKDIETAIAGDKISISNDVVATIAGIAAAEVPGVASLAGGIGNILGRKQLSKGIKVEIVDEKVVVDIALVIEYGQVIPEVAVALQNNVKASITSMTGLEVEAINVNVQGIALPEAAPVVEENAAE